MATEFLSDVHIKKKAKLLKSLIAACRVKHSYNHVYQLAFEKHWLLDAYYIVPAYLYSCLGWCE